MSGISEYRPADDHRAGPGMAAWCEKHYRILLGFLVVLALFLQVELFRHSPRSYGYVYDKYHHGIEVFYRTGRTPRAEDCWECYHPPLFYALGVPFYALGMKMTNSRAHALSYTRILPILCGFWTIWFGYRLIQRLVRRPLYRLLAAALLMGFPCLFISMGGIEGDILVVALLVTFQYYLFRYFSQPERGRWKTAVLLGVICGLAMATKYNGLLGLLVAGELTFVMWLKGPRRWARIRDGLAILGICLLIGGWRYVENQIQYGTAFKTNATVNTGLPFFKKDLRWDYYEFFTLRMGQLLELFRPEDAPDGKLTFVPVYKSFWSTLHAMAWSDMSFFSDPRRHGGSRRDGYPDRGIPPWLPSSVLILALVPGVLAALGFLTTLRRKVLLPLTLTVATTLVMYVLWVVQYHHWMLKTKYILHLLPAYVLCVCFGLRWIQTRAPRWVTIAVTGLLMALLALTNVYLYKFAVGK